MGDESNFFRCVCGKMGDKRTSHRDAYGVWHCEECLSGAIVQNDNHDNYSDADLYDRHQDGHDPDEDINRQQRR